MSCIDTTAIITDNTGTKHEDSLSRSDIDKCTDNNFTNSLDTNTRCLNGKIAAKSTDQDIIQKKTTMDKDMMHVQEENPLLHEEDELIYEGDEEDLIENTQQDLYDNEDNLVSTSQIKQNNGSNKKQNSYSKPEENILKDFSDNSMSSQKLFKETTESSKSIKVPEKHISNKPSTKSSTSLKHITGLSFIIGLKVLDTGEKKTKAFFDCVLCSQVVPSNYDGLGMYTHVNSKEHALNVLELSNNNMFQKYKDNNKISKEELLTIVIDWENQQEKQHLVPATSGSHLKTREKIMQKIASIKKKDVISRSLQYWKPQEQDDIMQSSYASIQYLEKSFLKRSFKKIVIVTDVSINLPPKDSSKTPVSAVKISDMNLSRLIDQLKKLPDFNNSTLFLICLSSFSLFDKSQNTECVNLDCKNPSFVFKYKNQDIVEQVLNLAQEVIASTENDSVLFTGIIPTDFNPDVGFIFSNNQCDDGSHKIKIYELGSSDETEQHFESISKFNYFVRSFFKKLLFPDLMLEESYQNLLSQSTAKREADEKNTNKIFEVVKEIDSFINKTSQEWIHLKLKYNIANFTKEPNAEFSNVLLLNMDDSREPEKNNFLEKVNWHVVDSYYGIEKCIQALKAVCSLVCESTLIIILRNVRCLTKKEFNLRDKCERKCDTFKERNIGLAISETKLHNFKVFAQKIPETLTLLQSYLTHGSKIIFAPLEPTCCYVSNPTFDGSPKSKVGSMIYRHWNQWHNAMHGSQPASNAYLCKSMTLQDLKKYYAYSKYPASSKEVVTSSEAIGYPNMNNWTEISNALISTDLNMKNDVPVKFLDWKNNLLLFIRSKLLLDESLVRMQLYFLPKLTYKRPTVVFMIPEALMNDIKITFTEDDTPKPFVWQLSAANDSSIELQEACEKWKHFSLINGNNVMFAAIIDLAVILNKMRLSPAEETKSDDKYAYSLPKNVSFDDLKIFKTLNSIEDCLGKSVFYAPVFPRLFQVIAQDESSNAAMIQSHDEVLHLKGNKEDLVDRVDCLSKKLCTLNERKFKDHEMLKKNICLQRECLKQFCSVVWDYNETLESNLKAISSWKKLWYLNIEFVIRFHGRLSVTNICGSMNDLRSSITSRSKISNTRRISTNSQNKNSAGQLGHSVQNNLQSPQLLTESCRSDSYVSQKEFNNITQDASFYSNDITFQNVEDPSFVGTVPESSCSSSVITDVNINSHKEIPYFNPENRLEETNRYCESFMNSVFDMTRNKSTNNFTNVVFIGKQATLRNLADINLKASFIYHNLDVLKEDANEFPKLLRKLGPIKPQTLCCLVFSLSVITSVKSISDACLHAGCSKAIPIYTLKSSKGPLSTDMIISKRIEYIISIVSKLSAHIPTVVLPLYPTRIHCDDIPSHTLSHGLHSKKSSFIVKGSASEWKFHLLNLRLCWNKLLVFTHKTFGTLSCIEKFIDANPEFFLIKGTYNDFECFWSAPKVWSKFVEATLKSVISVSEARGQPSNIDEDEVVVKLWNFSSTVIRDFLKDFATVIDPKVELEEREDFYLLKFSKRSFASLIVGQLNNLCVVDSTIQAKILGDENKNLEALTQIQKKFISSVYSQVYTKWKSSIAEHTLQSITKVVDVVNFKNVKCEGLHCSPEKCVFFHNLFDYRRNPCIYRYSLEMCGRPVGDCPRGNNCSYSHNAYEQMYFPSNYETSLCPNGSLRNCLNTPVCKFAHADSPELFNTIHWQDLVVYRTDNSIKYLAGAIRSSLKTSIDNLFYKVLFVSPSLELLQHAEILIKELLMQYSLSAVVLTGRQTNTDPHQVFLTHPKWLARHQIFKHGMGGVLIVDDAKSIYEDESSANCILKLLQDFRRSKAKVNKVFVSSTYEPGSFGIISRFFGLKLKEVTEPTQLKKMVHLEPVASSFAVADYESSKNVELSPPHLSVSKVSNSPSVNKKRTSDDSGSQYKRSKEIKENTFADSGRALASTRYKRCRSKSPSSKIHEDKETLAHPSFSLKETLPPAKHSKMDSNRENVNLRSQRNSKRSFSRWESSSHRHEKRDLTLSIDKQLLAPDVERSLHNEASQGEPIVPPLEYVRPVEGFLQQEAMLYPRKPLLPPPPPPLPPRKHLLPTPPREHLLVPFPSSSYLTPIQNRQMTTFSEQEVSTRIFAPLQKNYSLPVNRFPSPVGPNTPYSHEHNIRGSPQEHNISFPSEHKNNSRQAYLNSQTSPNTHHFSSSPGEHDKNKEFQLERGQKLSERVTGSRWNSSSSNINNDLSSKVNHDSHPSIKHSNQKENFEKIQPNLPYNSPITPSAPSMVAALSCHNEDDMTAFRLSLGPDLYSHYEKELQAKKDQLDAEYSVFADIASLHPNFEVHYDDFVNEYNRQYPDVCDEAHKEFVWSQFWKVKVLKVKQWCWEQQLLELKEEFRNKVEVLELEASKATASEFSVKGTLDLLKSLSGDIGMLGPSLMAMLDTCYRNGIDNEKSLDVFIDSDNVAIINIILGKFDLSKLSSSSPIKKETYNRAIKWVKQLLSVANSRCGTSKINLEALAKASVGKSSVTLINMIKNSFLGIGVENPSKEQINELYIKVCGMHFDMTL